MRAAVCRSTAPPEVVASRTSRRPAAGPGQVRVRVGAAAVNFPDVLLVADRYQLTVPPPFVPGSELAGVVDRGRRRRAPASRSATGSLGTTLVGAFAEEAVRRPRAVRPHPRRGRRSATPPPSGWRTAPRTTSCARSPGCSPGEELVVLGAGGGVGLAAVQLGVRLGASVTAVASSAEKLEVAASYGRPPPRSTTGPVDLRADAARAPARRRRRRRRPGRRRSEPSRRCGRCAGAAAS